MINQNKNAIEMFGVKEIQKMFDQFPEELHNVAWRTFWRQVGQPVKKAAKEKADRISAESDRGTYRLGKSLGFFSTKVSRKFNGLYFGPRVKGVFAKKNEAYSGKNRNKMYSRSGFYGAWVEFGGSIKFGNKGIGEDQPFMAPAFEETKSQMNASAREKALKTVERIRKRMEKSTIKYGYLGRNF